MKNYLSIALNVILLIAVGVLYYFHFTGKETGSSPDSKQVLAPKEIKSSEIVFVNLDTLNLKYEYLKDISAAATSEQQSLERQYTSQATKLQQDFITLQQNVEKGLFTEKEAMVEQQLLMKRRDKLDELEYKSQQLMEKIEIQNAQANKNLREYITEYNKQSNYTYVLTYTDNLPVVLLADPNLDITTEILNGLNQQYRAEKEAKKKK
jgi:outer membrane protein